jgi:hypothetical protein
MVIGHLRSACGNRLPAQDRPSLIRPLSDSRCFECRMRDPPTKPSRYCLKTCPHWSDFAPTRECQLTRRLQRLIKGQRIPSAYLQVFLSQPRSPNRPSTSWQRPRELQDDAENAEASAIAPGVHHSHRMKSTNPKASKTCANGYSR